MAIISEIEQSRTGSSEGLNSTRYVRQFRVLLDPKTDLPDKWETFTDAERRLRFPSITGLVRNNIAPWGDPHPWNANALAVRWSISEITNPMHYIVSVDYEVGEVTTQIRGVPFGWSMSVSGSTINRQLLQELPEEQRRGRLQGNMQIPKIIGPPKFVPVIDLPIPPGTGFTFKDDPQQTIYQLNGKREPIGHQIEEPMANVRLSRLISNFDTSKLGSFIANLGKVNSDKFLGAEPAHIRFKSIDANPQAGDLNVTVTTGGIIWKIEFLFEWRSQPFDPLVLTWWRTDDDGSRSIMLDDNGQPVKESFRVALRTSFTRMMSRVA